MNIEENADITFAHPRRSCSVSQAWIVEMFRSCADSHTFFLFFLTKTWIVFDVYNMEINYWCLAKYLRSSDHKASGISEESSSTPKHACSSVLTAAAAAATVRWACWVSLTWRKEWPTCPHEWAEQNDIHVREKRWLVPWIVLGPLPLF